jgi:hypothetical protein
MLPNLFRRGLCESLRFQPVVEGVDPDGAVKPFPELHAMFASLARFVEIEKKFKGKLPLTICRLTPKREAALSTYSQALMRALGTKQNQRGKGSRRKSTPASDDAAFP